MQNVCKSEFPVNLKVSQNNKPKLVAQYQIFYVNMVINSSNSFPIYRMIFIYYAAGSEVILVSEIEIST